MHSRSAGAVVSERRETDIEDGVTGLGVKLRGQLGVASSVDFFHCLIVVRSKRAAVRDGRSCLRKQGSFLHCVRFPFGGRVLWDLWIGKRTRGASGAFGGRRASQAR